MTTARDIVKGALRKISAMGIGQSLQAEEANDALILLNVMLSSLSVQGDLVYSETQESFALTGGDGEYTIGSGGDFDTVRPTRIDAVTVTQGDVDYSLNKIDKVAYSQISQKDIGGISGSYYYDAGYPLGTIRLYTVPEGVTTIKIYSEKPLAQFADLDAVFSMPQEYESMLIYNLAVWIAPEYEREAPPTVSRVAKQTLTAIRAQNNKNGRRVAYIDVPERTQGYDRTAILRGQS